MKRFGKLWGLMLVAGVTAGVTACGGGTDDIADRLDLNASVRLVNTAQQSPSVSLFRGEESQAYALNKTYKSASPYGSVSPGTATWSARTGTAATTAVASSTFDSQRGNRNTLLLINTPNTTAVEFLLITDPYGKNLTTDRARVRVAHLVSGGTPVDLYLTTGTDISTAAPNFSNIGYRTSVPATGSDSFEFAPGDYRIQVTAAGSKTVIFSQTLNIPGNTDWLFVALPGNDGSTQQTNSAIRLFTVQGNGASDGATGELVSQ